MGISAVSAGKRVYRFFSVEPVKTASRIGITVLFVVLVNRGIGRGDIASLCASLAPLPVTVAFVFGMLTLFLQVMRWRIILRAHNLPCTLTVAARTMFKGFLYAFITPGRVGELFRAVELSPARKKETVLAVFEERFFGIAATVITGAVAFVIEMVVLKQEPFYPLVIATVLFIFSAGAVIVVIVTRRKLPDVFHRNARTAEVMEGARTRIVSYPYTTLAVLSLGTQLALVAETVVLLSMFGASGTVRTALAAAQSYSFMLLLPFFIANIGLREYAFSFFLMRMTANPLLLTSTSGIALGSATAVLAFNIIMPAAIGLVWIFLGRKSVAAEADGSFTSDYRDKGNVTAERDH